VTRTQRKTGGARFPLLATLIAALCGGCQADANGDLTDFLTELALNAYAAFLL